MSYYLKILLIIAVLVLVLLASCVTPPSPDTPGATALLVFEQTVTTHGAQIQESNRHFEFDFQGNNGFEKTISLNISNTMRFVVFPVAGTVTLTEIRDIDANPAKYQTFYQYPKIQFELVPGSVTVLNYKFNIDISRRSDGLYTIPTIRSIGSNEVSSIVDRIVHDPDYAGWNVLSALRIAEMKKTKPVEESVTTKESKPSREDSSVVDDRTLSESVATSTVQEETPTVEADGMQRTALVIGNAGYKHFPTLQTPLIEADALTESLERLGFSVTLVKDANHEEMLDAIFNFETKLKERGGLALFHFGGHGVQVDGQNYLIPVGADIANERRIRTRAVNLDEIIASLEISGSRTNIIIVDACRDNPLPSASRSSTRGLSVATRQPPDSVIVYSAEAGTTAQDGVFTPTLIRYIEEPGMRFVDVLRTVRREVRIETNGSQRPGAYDQLETILYLAGK